MCWRLHRLIKICLPQKAYCSLCTSTASYGTNMVNYSSSGKKGLPGLCRVLPAASNFGELCCIATRTVLSVLSHSVQPLGPPSVNYLRHSADLPLSSVYPELSSVCYQTDFDSLIIGLRYFVSWGSYNDQICFPLLDAVISELLTTAPAHRDKHI